MADEVVRDEHGFDSEGVHLNGTPHDNEGYNANGWHNETNEHRDTGTVFHPETHRTINGDRFDDEGYDWEGYDRSGYDYDGTDRRGNSRCENGDCDDWSCGCHSEDEPFGGQLSDYGTDVVEAHDWHPHNPKALYAGNEIEMYSNEHEYDDVVYVRNQIDRLYKNCGPMTRSRRATVSTSDSSLEYKAGGFEIKIVPLTRKQMYYIFEKIDILGDRRCSAWTCGMEVGHHIHLSRAGLTELTIGKMGVFLNDPFNRSFLEHVAGRGPTYSHYENNKTIKNRRSGHGNLFNTGGYATVELRMFRSNLRGTGILKNYDFAMASAAFCADVDIRRSSVDWQRFLAWMTKHYAAYPHLHAFLKRPSYVADIYLPMLPKNARRLDANGTSGEAA